MDKFFTQKNCDRCKAELTAGRTMSRFNTDCICLTCAEKERQHPAYRKAVETELEQIHQGNRNYAGIGMPDELK